MHPASEKTAAPVELERRDRVLPNMRVLVTVVVRMTRAGGLGKKRRSGPTRLRADRFAKAVPRRGGQRALCKELELSNSSGDIHAGPTIELVQDAMHAHLDSRDFSGDAAREGPNAESYRRAGGRPIPAQCGRPIARRRVRCAGRPLDLGSLDREVRFREDRERLLELSRRRADITLPTRAFASATIAAAFVTVFFITALVNRDRERDSRQRSHP